MSDTVAVRPDHVPTISETSPDRRSFCLDACRLASLATLAPLLSACGGSPTSPSTNVPLLPAVTGAAAGGRVTVPADGASPLAAVGGAALVRSSVGEFLVSRSSATAAVAFTAECTHEGCTIEGIENATFVCRCHGSRFNTTGAVVNGPASRPLRQFAAAVEATAIVITL